VDAAGLVESADGFEVAHGGLRPPFPRALGKPANGRRFPTSPTGRGGALSTEGLLWLDGRLRTNRHATDPGGMLLKRPGPILLKTGKRPGRVSSIPCSTTRAACRRDAPGHTAPRCRARTPDARLSDTPAMTEHPSELRGIVLRAWRVWREPPQRPFVQTEVRPAQPTDLHPRPSRRRSAP
jgi:hypothetical protein